MEKFIVASVVIGLALCPFVFAFSGSSANYDITLGIPGLGLADGAGVNYNVKLAMYDMPVGSEIGNYSLFLGHYYLTDILPPAAPSVDNVDGDTDSPYWDTSNNSQTIVNVDADEDGVLCRWSDDDVPYSEIDGSHECAVSGRDMGCDLGNIAQTNSTIYHISCVDHIGNEQNISENTDVVFGVDYTEPSTYSTRDANIHAQGHNVTIVEYDIPANTTIYTWYCDDLSGICTPETAIDDGEHITFTSRGTNYLRYHSNDSAGNQQSVKEEEIYINQLPSVTDISYSLNGFTGKVGNSVYFYCDGLDSNGPINDQFAARIWIRLNGSSTWDRINGANMTYVGGTHDFRYEFTPLDAYPSAYDAQCQIRDKAYDNITEWGANHSEDNVFSVVNSAPIVDDLYTLANATKYQTLRFYCQGSDPDMYVTEANLIAKLYLGIQGSGQWNRINGSTMSCCDNNDHYIDYYVTDDGGTEYDGRCTLDDGGSDPHMGTLDAFKVPDTVIVDDWDWDGVSDAVDSFGGNVSHVNTTITDIGLLVNGSSNVTSYNDVHKVEFRSGTAPKVEFYWDFGAVKLDVHNVSIFKQNASATIGWVLVSGLNATNKTVYVDALSGSNQVCIKDAEISSIIEMSEGCAGGSEVLLSCPGDSGQYSCEVNGSQYRVSGLNHSAAKEFGNARINIWDDTDTYYRIINDVIHFYANYTNSSSGALITGADCQIWFSDWDNWSGMEESTYYDFVRSFPSGGTYDWNVSCGALGFSNLSLADGDGVVIYASNVPEFGALTLMMTMVLVIAGSLLLRRKERIFHIGKGGLEK